MKFGPQSKGAVFVPEQNILFFPPKICKKAKAGYLIFSYTGSNVLFEPEVC